ncbi:hypothetical protein B566_EDAN007277 [Ephemera danica]|nr:hypothetical protein B566_EDAN007277 [Ephemera danica]
MSGPWLCQLWMGGLEPYMTETFVRNAFEKAGETPQSVKVMRNKFTGEPAGYCFVHFTTDEMALDAMHKLNGKVIPGSTPPVRFKLNHASTTGRLQNDQEFSLWIGDLSPEVDDYQLYRLFASLILDSSGVSKGYGFVRFANEDDQRACLIDMNGYKGLGNKPLKISNAIPKSRLASQDDSNSNTDSATGAQASGTTAGTQSYYDQYWQNYQNWQQQGYGQDYYSQYTTDYNQQQQNNYDQQTAAAVAAAAAAARAIEQQPPLPTTDPTTVAAPPAVAAPISEDFQLVEHDVPIDIDALNSELCARDNLLWDAIMDSKWLPVEFGGTSVRNGDR